MNERDWIRRAAALLRHPVVVHAEHGPAVQRLLAEADALVEGRAPDGYAVGVGEDGHAVFEPYYRPARQIGVPVTEPSSSELDRAIEEARRRLEDLEARRAARLVAHRARAEVDAYRERVQRLQEQARLQRYQIAVDNHDCPVCGARRGDYCRTDRPTRVHSLRDVHVARTLAVTDEAVRAFMLEHFKDEIAALEAIWHGGGE